MPIRPLLLISATVIALAACRQEPETATNQAADVGNNATSGPIEDAPAVPLADPDGTIIGEVKGGDGDLGAELQISAQSLPPGVHGLHLHTVGLCEGPTFESAGPHWNPTNAKHGLQNPEGPHFGDLPNITVGPDGRFLGNVTIQGSYLKESRLKRGPGQQIIDTDGVALIIHELPDDNRTDPAGNTGGRIACAAITE